MSHQTHTSPDPAPDHSGAAILSLGQILAVVLAAVALAFLLIPKETELVERLVEDGRHARAKQLIVTPTADANAAPDTEGTETGQASDLIEIILTSNSDPIDEKGAGRISKLIEIADDPRAVHRLLKQEASRFTAAGHVACLDALATRAIQTEDSPFAVELYRQRWQIEPPNSEKIADIVAAHRYAGDPRGALDAITLYLQEHGHPFGRLPQELRMTAIALHREINQGSKAFDLLSEEYRSSLDDETRQDLIDLMTITAVQSERIADCLPVVESFVAALQPSTQSWQQLLTTTTSTDHENFLKYGIILARHREWSGDNQGAFDLYLKLASLGNMEALDRCVVIYPWIDAQHRAAEFLNAVAPIAERPQYTLLAARLEADRGNVARGIELIEPLTRDKEDPILWNEYAQMLNEAGRIGAAIKAYQYAAELNPANSTARKLSARLLISQGDFEAALSTLVKLPAAAHDKKSLEDFAMLASALSDPKAEEQALLLRLHLNSEHPVGGDYEDLSDFYKIHGDVDTAIDIAQSGIDALPENRNLAILLADHLSDAGQKNEAWQILSKHTSVGDPRIFSRLLDLSNMVDPFQSRTVLSEIASSSAQWPPAQRLEIAAMHEMNGQIDTALQLYKSTPAGAGDVARIEAEIAFAAGDVNRAVDLQRRYLETASEPDYEDWMFLGDLHQAAGNSTAARNSYEHALQMLRGRVDVDSALPDSTSVDSSHQENPQGTASTINRQPSLKVLEARRRFEARF